MFHPVKYEERKLQLKLTNLGVSSHDLVCDCPQPAFHTLKILCKQLSGELSPEQKQEIKKCLGLEDIVDALGEEDFDFGEDLEKLFEHKEEEDAPAG